MPGGNGKGVFTFQQFYILSNQRRLITRVLFVQHVH